MKTVSGRHGGTLTPWQKGQSGNPKGLPKGYKGIAAQMRETLAKNVEYLSIDNKKKRMRGVEALCVMLLARALYKKDMIAAQILINNADKDLEFLGDVNIQNNYQQNVINTGNPLNLSDQEVLKIAAILNASEGNNSPA